MIKFLLQRPIAVLMAFTACFIVGLVTYFTIPVSLLILQFRRSPYRYPARTLRHANWKTQ